MFVHSLRGLFGYEEPLAKGCFPITRGVFGYEELLLEETPKLIKLAAGVPHWQWDDHASGDVAAVWHLSLAFGPVCSVHPGDSHKAGRF